MTQPPQSPFPPYGGGDGNNGNNGGDNNSGHNGYNSNPGSDGGYKPGGYQAGGYQAGGNQAGGYQSGQDPYPPFGGQNPNGQQGQQGYQGYGGQSYGGQQAYPGSGTPNYGAQQGYQQYSGGQVDPTIGAGPWLRLAAYLIDLLVVGIPLGIVMGLLSVGSGINVEGLAFSLTTQWITGTVRVIVFFAYVTFLHTTKFQTVGKHLMGIAVVDENMNLVSLNQSAIRSLWLLAGLIPLMGGLLELAIGIAIFATAFQGDQRRGLDDQWAKTQVVKRSAVPALQ